MGASFSTCLEAIGLKAPDTAGAVVRGASASFFAEPRGLKGPGASCALLAGGSSFLSFFALAGLKALGVTAALYEEAALLSRFTEPAGLNGLEAPGCGASGALLAAPMRAKRDGASLC